MKRAHASILTWLIVALASTSALAGGGIDIGDGRSSGPVGGDARAPMPSEKGSQRTPTLQVVSLQLSASTLNEGETLKVVAEVVTPASGRAAGCWGRFASASERSFEVLFDSCEAVRTGEHSFKMTLTYKVPARAASGAFVIRDFTLLQRGQQEANWGEYWNPTVFRIQGSVLSPIAIEDAWFETLKGTSKVEQGESFDLVLATRGQGRITQAILLYSIDRGAGPTLETRKLDIEEDARKGGEREETRFSLDFWDGSEHAMHFEPLQILLFNDALQETRSMLPAELPVRQKKQSPPEGSVGAAPRPLD